MKMPPEKIFDFISDLTGLSHIFYPVQRQPAQIGLCHLRPFGSLFLGFPGRKAMTEKVLKAISALKMVS